MYIDQNTVIEFAKLVSALLTIGGIFLIILKWLDKQKKTSEKVTELEAKEETDKKEIEDKHDKDIKGIQSELCMLNYAVLAALDALCQQGYNGKVKEAQDKLSKHLNQQAHDQI